MTLPSTAVRISHPKAELSRLRRDRLDTTHIGADRENPLARIANGLTHCDTSDGLHECPGRDSPKATPQAATESTIGTHGSRAMLRHLLPTFPKAEH